MTVGWCSVQGTDAHAGDVRFSDCSRREASDLCIHMLFVLIKALKLRAETPLAWQLGLVDRELEGILGPPDETCGSNRAKKCSNGVPIVRKPLLQEDPCPICYEDMQKSGLRELVFCRRGCGGNVHGRCMRIWVTHQRRNDQDLSCPLCRAEWGEFLWTPPSRRGRPTRELKKPSITCSECKCFSITGQKDVCKSVGTAPDTSRKIAACRPRCSSAPWRIEAGNGDKSTRGCSGRRGTHCVHRTVVKIQSVEDDVLMNGVQGSHTHSSDTTARQTGAGGPTKLDAEGQSTIKNAGGHVNNTGQGLSPGAATSVHTSHGPHKPTQLPSSRSFAIPPRHCKTRGMYSPNYARGEQKLGAVAGSGEGGVDALDKFISARACKVLTPQ
eukprot:evm.model.scf_3110.1 EVM.evm.TU.scf_3110.1   scf_3110:648-6185(+)